MTYDAEPERLGPEFWAEMQSKAAARIEANPWIPVFRLVRDEADRTGNRYLIEMFAAWFKAYEASHYPRG
jgi:hypothetical protein